MDEPLVTVIVPGRDVGDFAAEALDSLRAQSFPRWRAILVDDGSTDATTAIFSAASADSRFTLIRHECAQGLGASRNEALDRVATPFVAFLDADDRYTPWALETLVAALTDSGSDVAVGAYVRLRPDGADGYRAGEVQPWVAAATAPARRRVTLAEHPAVSGNIVAWSKLSRIELWRRDGLRFAEGRMYEDQAVTQRLYVHARAIDVVPEVIVHWRERAEGTSITQRKDDPAVLRDYLEALESGLAVLDAAGHRGAARARIRLIGEMDLPPLVRIAQGHPAESYRRMLGEFVRRLGARAALEGIALAPDAAFLLAAARLW